MSFAPPDPRSLDVGGKKMSEEYQQILRVVYGNKPVQIIAFR